MAGAAIAAYSYLGFDAVSTLTEETIAPEKTMPRAIVLDCADRRGDLRDCCVYGAACTSGRSVQGSGFRSLRSRANVGGDIFVTVFLAGLILAQFASGISAQASVGRLLYAMGRDEVLPKRIFGFIHPKFKTPAMNIAIAGAIGLVALKLDVATSTSFINFGAFLAFTAVNLCVVRISLQASATRDGCDRRPAVPAGRCGCGYLAAGEPREDRAGAGRDLVRAGACVSWLDHALFPPGAAGSGGLKRGWPSWPGPFNQHGLRINKTWRNGPGHRRKIASPQRSGGRYNAVDSIIGSHCSNV